VALVIAGPGATVLLTFRVAPQPAEITAAVKKTLTANVRIASSSTQRGEEESMRDATS
jgi:hypothetical protein